MSDRVMDSLSKQMIEEIDKEELNKIKKYINEIIEKESSISYNHDLERLADNGGPHHE